MQHVYPSHLRACFVSTYPPRQCGIATFTADLCHALCQGHGNTPPSVIALTNTPHEYPYPPEVVFEIRQNRLRDYRLATEYINLSSVDIICLQHEFGIFGGQEGRYITALLKGLRKPVVTTLHTVLRTPTPAYREALLSVAMLSDHLVVMNSKAIPILCDVYRIAPEKISLLHHGVPEAPFVDPNYYKDKFGVEGRLVLLTFGLLSRNKGIDLMLSALPAVVRAHPEVVYIIFGATHPEVRRSEGEAYRLTLQGQVRVLHLEDHVVFYDRYVERQELLEFLGACDIYVTPYQAQEQIVSGTLAYAVGLGKAVVSTPYLYAEEILAEGRGQLVPFGDAPGLAHTLIVLIENEVERHRMRKLAYAYGQQMLWSEVAKGYRTLFARAATTYRQHALARPVRKRPQAGYELPEIKLDHLRRLTDDTGILQHATYGVPDWRFGYTTDDAARALVVTLLHYRQCGDDTALDLATRYLSFLAYAQRPDGHFHNVMSYTRQFLDECGSEDTLGRALWGLGTAVALAPGEGMRALARERFERALDALVLTHPRAMAYAICGLYHFLQRYAGAAWMRRKLLELAEQLAGWYARSGEADRAAPADAWHWFGDALTYANAKMPQALLLAHGVTGAAHFRHIGLASLDFLLAETYRDGYFDFIGNQGWYRRGGARAILGQQPIEAGYTAEACLTAYELTGEGRYLQLAQAAAEWLLGRNRFGARLYDLATGACADGLDPQGPSLNQGAESVICALLTLLVVAEKRASIMARRPPQSATPTAYVPGKSA